MSGLVTGLTLQHLPLVDHSTFLVAIVLSDQADHEGNNIFPSIGLIGCLAGISERATQYSMRDLENVGFISAVKKGGGRNNPTKYKINLDWLVRQPNKMEKFRKDRDLKKGARVAPINETVQAVQSDEGNGAETVQKGCKKGAPAIAPDPLPVDPYTPPPAKQVVGGVSIEELLEAAFWKQCSTKKPEKTESWKAKVRARLKNPTRLDLDTLAEWKQAKEREKETLAKVQGAKTLPAINAKAQKKGDELLARMLAKGNRKKFNDSHP